MQGYLTNGSRPYQKGDIQFSRTVEDLKLKSCLKTENVGKTIINSLNTNPDATTDITAFVKNGMADGLEAKVECFAQSAVWRTGDTVTQATSRATNIPISSCPIYQANFASRAQAAHDAWFSCGDTASAAPSKISNVHFIVLGLSVLTLAYLLKDQFENVKDELQENQIKP